MAPDVAPQSAPLGAKHIVRPIYNVRVDEAIVILGQCHESLKRGLIAACENRSTPLNSMYPGIAVKRALVTVSEVKVSEQVYVTGMEMASQEAENQCATLERMINVLNLHDAADTVLEGHPTTSSARSSELIKHLFDRYTRDEAERNETEAAERMTVCVREELACRKESPDKLEEAVIRVVCQVMENEVREHIFRFSPDLTVFSDGVLYFYEVWDTVSRDMRSNKKYASTLNNLTPYADAGLNCYVAVSPEASGWAGERPELKHERTEVTTWIYKILSTTQRCDERLRRVVQSVADYQVALAKSSGDADELRRKAMSEFVTCRKFVSKFIVRDYDGQRRCENWTSELERQREILERSKKNAKRKTSEK